MVSEYLMITRKKTDNDFVIKLGLDLYNHKIRDYTCMQSMLNAMTQAGYNEEKIAPYKEEMNKLFPDKTNIWVWPTV